jgi:hypothetical protein
LTDGKPSAVKRSYDKFDDYTSLSAEVVLGSTAFVMGLRHLEDGDVVAPKSVPARVIISVYKRDREAAENLVFIADGVRIIPELSSSTSWEWAYYDLNTRDLLTLFDAKVVEGRVGLGEFTLTPGDKLILRDFAAALNPVD